MSDEPAELQLLREIRDLLKEQKALIADIRAQNEAMAARNLEHMAKAEALAQSQIAQNAAALGAFGTGRWLKWGFWIFLALLLLVFAGPTLWSLLFLRA